MACFGLLNHSEEDTSTDLQYRKNISTLLIYSALYDGLVRFMKPALIE